MIYCTKNDMKIIIIIIIIIIMKMKTKTIYIIRKTSSTSDKIFYILYITWTAQYIESFTLNSKAIGISSLGTDKEAAAYKGGTLQCAVSRSEGFLFLNSVTASSIAVSIMCDKICMFIVQVLPCKLQIITSWHLMAVSQQNVTSWLLYESTAKSYK